MIEKKCSNCKKLIYRTANQVSRSKTGLFYCSNSCSAIHKNPRRTKRIEKKCSNCKKLIYRTASQVSRSKTGLFYCSGSCSAICNNKNPKRTRTKKCKKCNLLILGHRSYCDDCYVSKHYIHHKTLKAIINSRKNDSNRYTGVRGNARLIYHKSNKPKCCVVCGYDKHFEICHIKDIAEFPKTALVSEVNCIENLTALCRNCHWEFDNKLIDITQYI